MNSTAPEQITFDDGEAYEDFMGRWSLLAGERFLDWVKPPTDLDWLDVGCGNGAFTELLMARTAPRTLHAIDPSAAQLAFARTRQATSMVDYVEGDAMALPYAERAFDAAVMALVIFFVPRPDEAVAEMVRVVRPGGLVCAYVWDMLAGGFPYALLHEEMAHAGLPPMLPPRVDVSRAANLHALWQGAGLGEIRAQVIEVERRFANFEDFWQTASRGPSAARRAQAEPEATLALKARVKARMSTAGTDALVVKARANAISGRVPR